MGNHSVPEEIRKMKPKGTMGKAINGKSTSMSTPASCGPAEKATKMVECIGYVANGFRHLKDMDAHYSMSWCFRKDAVADLSSTGIFVCEGDGKLVTVDWKRMDRDDCFGFPPDGLLQGAGTLFRAHGERDDPWRGAEGGVEASHQDKRERCHTPLEDGED
jgi:hypothetical protein